MSDKRVLIIDDEEALRAVLSDLFGECGYKVTTAGDGDSGLATALSEDFDLIMLDLSLPGADGLSVLCEVKQQKPATQVIMMTGYASMQHAIEAMKLGAYDFITKPFDLNEVQLIAQRATEHQQLIDENKYLKEQLKQTHGFDNVIGSNPQIQQAYILAAQVADSNASVLIVGETGTGKEYLARAIHYQSSRAGKAFVKVNCGALPESLLESELFGHEKGAFTNAVARRIGRFELADGGTIFLDEIGDISQTTQMKLLRVLQEKEFERVGSSETIKVDVRIIAATNKDLKRAIADKEFREDLYYRLNVITISLPPLRDRPEDIPLLAEHFLRRYGKETGKRIDGISPEGMDMLLSCGWPGNIRELQNCMERAVILCHGRRITPSHLLVSSDSAKEAPVSPSRELRSLSQVEKEHIDFVLSRCDRNQTRAASVLGIDRKTLRNKIREYDLGTEIAGSGSD
jgi:DNA-binding NtrC family response regulator